MNFDFSEEQEEIRRQARRFLSENRESRRRVVDGEALYDRGLWQAIVDMGWTATAIAEEHGGIGLGYLELCVLAEEFGSSLLPVPFVSSVLQASEAIKLAEDPERAAEWLPRLAAGEVIATVAFAEEGAGKSWSDLPQVQVVGGRLTGCKVPVADGLVADVAVVSARAPEDGDGFGWFLVRLAQPGVERLAEVAVDRLRKHARLTFDNAEAIRLGQPGAGREMALRLMDVAAVLGAFEQLGGAEAALAIAVEYTLTRQVFGRVVASYQAVKHKLADIYVKNQLARSHAYFGAWALSHQAQELPLAAAGARLAASDAFNFAAEESVELHGGIGFTWESDCQLFYRRARLLAASLGGRQRWSRRLVGELARQVAPVIPS
ncbi:acyl-CoA/acyl-ACP dehydrogenase [Pseudomonas citronellolis]|uniref:Acyl-CoA/acyl-ACP dehydrogenase n=1 Tax=Pseudomonas citronellolis TaxID=53408 RepID=A0AAW6P6Z2_9PSED|nr:acyl-CoA dehydrogenase family protein [Pseudomonas citronellolis]MDF3842957.1 acyl-CoA/acyl-ACP dehydrogenase [Pseudomonas citronellolis]